MYHNYQAPTASDLLPTLLKDLLGSGDEISSRAGVVKELTHVGITLTEPWKREITCPRRKPNIAAQIAETVWVLAGMDDIEWLGRYLPRSKDFSDDGQTWRAGYGKRLRRWSAGDSDVVDQLRYVVETLQTSHSSRQAVASIWDPVIDTNPGKDIPCNNWLSFSSRLGKLDLMVAIRSNDVIWGWSGINAFEWSALQEIVAGLLGVDVGGLHFAVTSLHLYDRHWSKARDIALADHEYDGRIAAAGSPRFDASALRSKDIDGLDDMLSRWLDVEQMIRRGHPEANVRVASFPEPMLRSWLRVIQWWWSADRVYITPLLGSNLELGVLRAIQPPARDYTELKAADVVIQTLSTPADPIEDGDVSEFLRAVFRLHREKHVAYGDSWKRRGEMLGIMANIARKIDRLGGAETADETAADTAIDLMVYLAKYRVWLSDFVMGTNSSDHPEPANDLMHTAEVEWMYNVIKIKPELLEDALRFNFDKLETLVVEHDMIRTRLVDEMLADAYVLARGRWELVQS